MAGMAIPFRMPRITISLNPATASSSSFLKKGAVMLRNNPELNITEISDRIGFSSSRYFSKCFKEIYHVSPLAYRKGEEKEEGDGEETDNLYNGDNN